MLSNASFLTQHCKQTNFDFLSEDNFNLFLSIIIEEYENNLSMEQFDPGITITSNANFFSGLSTILSQYLIKLKLLINPVEPLIK